MNPCNATLSPKSKPKKNEGENIRYTSSNMILLKTAMKNSMKNEGGLKAMLANTMIIKSKRVSKSQCCLRRRNFRTTSSRLSIMSTAQKTRPSHQSCLDIISPSLEDLPGSPMINYAQF